VLFRAELPTKHITAMCGHNVEFFGDFAQLRRETISVVTYFRPSAWNNLALTGWIFIKFHIGVFFEKTV